MLSTVSNFFTDLLFGSDEEDTAPVIDNETGEVIQQAPGRTINISANQAIFIVVLIIAAYWYFKGCG